MTEHLPEDELISEKEEAPSWPARFFGEFWPIILFGGFFLLMVSLPLIFSGFLSMYAFFIVGGVLGALAIGLLLPKFLGLYMLVLALTLLFSHPDPIGPVFYTVIITFFVAGAILLPKRKKREGTQDATPIQPKVLAKVKEAPAEAVAPVPVQKVFKPVVFDRNIAAEGVTIIFGSESGNAEGLAELTKNALSADGHAVQILDAAMVDTLHLKAFANLLILTSTWGEGDPPSNAIDLTEGVIKNREMKLAGQFSVLSLGDTNYEHFCKCGKDFDSNLERMGATRFYKRVDCDVAFEEPFKDWLNGVKGALKGNLKKLPVYDETADVEKFAAKSEPQAA